MELKKVQELLKSLGIYSGDIDGDNGSLTKEAVKVFQRAWELKVDGIPGPMTQRTLSYVSAEKVLVDGAC